MKQALDKSFIKTLIKTGVLIAFVYGGIIYLFVSFVATIVRSY